MGAPLRLAAAAAASEEALGGWQASRRERLADRWLAPARRALGDDALEGAPEEAPAPSSAA